MEDMPAYKFVSSRGHFRHFLKQKLANLDHLDVFDAIWWIKHRLQSSAGQPFLTEVRFFCPFPSERLCSPTSTPLRDALAQDSGSGCCYG